MLRLPITLGSCLWSKRPAIFKGQTIVLGSYEEHTQ
jgi:hypothetical protein